MKILLLQPPIEDFYLNEIRTYPLGLLYIATLLKDKGVEVEILDALRPFKKVTIPVPKEFNYLKSIYSEKETGPIKLFGAYYRFGLSDKEIIERIKDSKPDIVAITCNFTAYFDSTAKLIKKLKSDCSNIKVMIGGYHPTIYAKEIKVKYPFIDYIVQGASEEEILKILDLKYAPEDCFTQTIPDRTLINSADYKMHKQNFSFLIATRGCLKNCTFCTVSSMHGSKFLLRSVDSIIQEMLELYNHHQVRVFDFEDDNLSLNQKWFKELLEQIIISFPKKDIRFYAMNGISAETLSTSVLTKMWEAGFRNLNISLVTAQDNKKKGLNRPFFNEQFEKAVKVAKEIGYEITAYFILGLPKQDKSEIEATIKYLSDLDVLVTPSIYYPPPGTEMMKDLVVDNLIDEQNWIMFRSSVFAVETTLLRRSDLVFYFQYVRMLNFIAGIKKKYGLTELTLQDLNKISEVTLASLDISGATEEEIGVAQVKEFLNTGEIVRVYRS